MSEKHQSDMKAAYTGLLLGALALLIVVFSIVKLVNASFSEKPAAAHTSQQ